MSWSAHKALEYWVEKKLLSKKKAEELRVSIPEDRDHLQARAIGIFTTLGGVLIGLGVMLFVASHWGDIPPHFKTGLLLLVTLASGVAAYVFGYEKGYEKTGTGLFLVNILAYGATIFLIAQIYHLPLDFWWGALLWCVGTAFFAYVLQSRMHVWLSIPLLILAIGWMHTAAGGRGELDFLFSDRWTILPMFGFLGLALIAASLLHNRMKALHFGAQTLFHWGLFLILFLLTISTIEKQIFFAFLRYPLDAVGIGVAVAALIAFVCALVFGRFETAQGRGGLIALAAYLALVTILAYVPQWMGVLSPATIAEPYAYGYNLYAHPMLTGFFIVHVVLVFVFCLTVIWFGSLLRRPAVINLGMIAIAVCIFIQYFSWIFALLPRSFAFIVGGVLILALGLVLERQRRRLMASISQSPSIADPA